MPAAKKIPFRTQQEDDLLRQARRYARMKTFGIAVENDHTVKYGAADREEMATYLGQMLLSKAIDLLGAMAIDEIDGELTE